MSNFYRVHRVDVDRAEQLDKDRFFVDSRGNQIRKPAGTRVKSRYILEIGFELEQGCTVEKMCQLYDMLENMVSSVIKRYGDKINNDDTLLKALKEVGVNVESIGLHLNTLWREWVYVSSFADSKREYTSDSILVYKGDNMII